MQAPDTNQANPGSTAGDTQLQQQVAARPADSSNSILKSQAGGMILLTLGIVGCALIAWGFQRNARRKLAAQEEEYLSIVRDRPTFQSPPPARQRAGGQQNQIAEPKSAPRSAEVAQTRSQSELAADVAEIATLRHDLRDLGRRVVGDIDSRLASLETVIERAQAVAQRLEQAMMSVPQASSTQASRPDSFVEVAPLRPSLPFEGFSNPAPAGSMHDPRSPRDETRTIIELAEQGVPAREIAQRLGRPIGQVELIIALRGKGTPVAR